MYTLTIPTFRITMVGNTNSGKTTFAAAVCKRLIEDSIEGIQILPSRMKSSGAVEEAETLYAEQTQTYEYKANLRLLEDRTWPGGTGETVEWNLDLLYHGKKLASIAWIDYRGGLVSNPALDPTAPGLYATIYNSEALIFFVDAYELTHYENDPGQGDVASGANRIRELILSFTRKPEYLSRSSSPSNAERLIFLIALSKVDAVPRKYRRNYSALVSRAKHAFSGLKTVLERQRQWYGAIVPVTSVGENVVVMDEDERTNGQPTINGQINPINVEIAMFYCISKYLRIFAQDETLAEKVSAHKGFLRRNPSFATENDYETAKGILEVIEIMDRLVLREVKSLI